MSNTIMNYLSLPDLNRLDPEWLHVVEDHLPYLRGKARYHEVNKQKAYEHRGNFYAYVQSLGYDVRYHHMLLRVNGWHSPHEFTEAVDVIMIVEPPYLEDIYHRYLNTFVNEEQTRY